MNILTQALKSILGLEASTPCGEHASTQPTVAAAGGETTVGNEKLPDRDFNKRYIRIPGPTFNPVTFKGAQVFGERKIL